MSHLLDNSTVIYVDSMTCLSYTAPALDDRCMCPSTPDETVD